MMRTKFLFSSAIALILVGIVAITPALAAETFLFRGQNAAAYFSSYDDCVDTSVAVFVGENVFQDPPGSGIRQSVVAIYITRYNPCTSTYVMAAYGDVTLDDAAFQVQGQLKSATLNATIPVFDYVSETWLDVVVDLDWTGTGPLSRGNFHSHFQAPGCTINERSNGSSRSAEASGSVSLGTVNFTPNPSYYANLNDSKSGTVQIGCDT